MANGDVSDERERPSVLAASVHDVRYLAALLRGVNFVNRATLTITKSGFTVTVEEARTLLATAYVFKDVFDEYAYNPENPTEPTPSQGSENSQVEHADNAAIEIPLNILMECLNIFGTAGPSLSSNNASKYRTWRRADENSDHEREEQQNRLQAGNGRLEQYFGSSDKRTGMRMSYVSSGHPLTLLLAEDAAGPTTTCEITTFEPEPHLQLPFDPQQTVLKIILKSSWLHEALSELDPSCEKLSFIGNPAVQAGNASRSTPSKPIFRIQAGGTFGSTQMDYPNDREVLETFECQRSVTVSAEILGYPERDNSYRFSHISRALRALQSSTKTSLRIDEEGLLSLQFLMPTPKPRGGTSDAFIEFRCQSLEEPA